MKIQVPAGMTYQQYVQTPAGQRDMQAMQNWFGGGASASAAPSQPTQPGMQPQWQSINYDPNRPAAHAGIGVDINSHGGWLGYDPGISMRPGMPPTRCSSPRPQATPDFNKQRRQQELDFRAAKQAMQPGRATSVATFSGGTPYSPPRRPASSRPPAGRFPTRP